MSISEIRHGRHVVYKLVVHLVFVTKYRRGVLTGRVMEVVEESLRKVCRDFECDLLEFNGEEDHVHLLLSYPPKIALSRLVNSLKGVSARRVLSENFPEVRNKLWKGHLWSPSYFAGSAGGATLETLKRYIQAQQSPDGDSPSP